MMSRLISITRFAFSLILAPVVAAFVAPSVHCGWSALHGLGASSCVVAFAGYGWYGLIPATIATIVFCCPLALLAIRFGLVVSWQFAAGGALGGLAAALSLWTLDRALNVGGLAAITTSAGALAALAVWLIGVRGNVSVIRDSARPIGS